MSEAYIMQINFYSGQEKLVQVEEDDDWYVKKYVGRIESFEIADDERLIGAELDYEKDYSGNNCFVGVTWIKMKVSV